MLERLKKKIFLWCSKSVNKKNFFASPPDEFYPAILDARTWVDFALRDMSLKGAIAFLDFLIDTVADDMRTSAAAEILYRRPSRDWRLTIPPFYTWADVSCQKVSSQGNTVISSVYEWDKLYRAVKDIEEDGFRTDWDHYSCVYYPEIRLMVVGNGIHHSCVAAQYQKHGIYKADIFPLESLFPFVRTDGRRWYNINDQEVKETPEYDVRFSILYELARMKHHLEQTGGLSGFAVGYIHA